MKYLFLIVIFLIQITTILTPLLINGKIIKEIKDNGKYYLYTSIVVILILNIIFYIYFRIEKTIYFWDYSGFWIRTIELKSNLDVNGLKSTVQMIYTSMNYSEHSYLSSMMLMPWVYTFGNTFYSFVTAVLNLFIIPTMFYLIVCCNIVFKNKHKYFNLLITLLYFPLYAVLFKGYIDGMGLLFVLILIISYFSDDNYTRDFIIVINCFLLIFLRRWFLFFVVAYYLTDFIFILIQRKDKRVTLKHFVLRSIWLFGIIIVFFNHYFISLFTNNLSVAYSAYKINSLQGELINYTEYFGLILMLLLMISIIKSMIKQESKLVYLVIITVIIVLLFSIIQSFDNHHFYLIVIPSYFLLMYLVNDSRMLRIICSSLLICNFLFMLTNFNSILVTNMKIVPTINNEKQAIIDLVDYMNNISSDNQYIYLSASSLEINADILRNSKLPETRNAIPNLINTSDIDLRDGFPKNFEYIDFVITVNPTQFHTLDKSSQSINAIINDLIQNDEIVKQAYEMLESFNINDKEIKIFKRISPLSEQTKKIFRDKINTIYPNLDLMNGF